MSHIGHLWLSFASLPAIAALAAAQAQPTTKFDGIYRPPAPPVFAGKLQVHPLPIRFFVDIEGRKKRIAPISILQPSYYLFSENIKCTDCVMISDPSEVVN